MAPSNPIHKYRIWLKMTDAEGGTWEEGHIIEAVNDHAAETESEGLADMWINGTEPKDCAATEVSVEIYALAEDGDEDLVRDFQHGGILDASGTIYRDQCDHCTTLLDDAENNVCLSSPDGRHRFNFGSVDTKGR